MPAVFLDRLPLPSLRAYTGASILLLSCSFYYAAQITSNTDWKINSTSVFQFHLNDAVYTGENVTSTATLEFLISGETLLIRILEIIYFMIQEPLCIWTLINMAYCCLILVGKVIQKLVFGELRVSEQQHIKDKFWNFVFYKFIFIFGVMNVQFMYEVVLWCSWFSALGFFHLLAQLCKDRFEYLSFSPTTPRRTHIRLLALLSLILVVSSSLFGICIAVGLHAGLNTFAFMAAECALVTVRTLYVIVRYAIHLYDINYENVWEKRSMYIYFTELVFELAASVIDFFHHLHMLLWGNIFLSMASLVICMQLRYLFYEIQRRIKKHKNYLRVVLHMEANYPMATEEEIEKNCDDCAICWDKMDAARKLPCGHLFHNSCLTSWLEQDTSCPTCRLVLSGSNPSNVLDVDARNNLLEALRAQNNVQGRQPNQTTNHFFHFDGSRYVSWLPSFSVEVTHTNLLGEREPPPVQTSQLDNMARQVQQLFPHISHNAIIEDLHSTRSVELTIENILDGHLVSMPTVYQPVTSPAMENSNLLSIDYPDSNLMIQHPFQAEEKSSSSLQNDSCSASNDIDCDDKTAVGSGCRFSKSSKEREFMLNRRKEELLRIARKRYVQKKECHPTQRSDSSSLDESPKAGSSGINSVLSMLHQSTEGIHQRHSFRNNSET